MTALNKDLLVPAPHKYTNSFSVFFQSVPHSDTQTPMTRCSVCAVYPVWHGNSYHIEIVNVHIFYPTHKEQHLSILIQYVTIFTCFWSLPFPKVKPRYNLNHVINVFHRMKCTITHTLSVVALWHAAGIISFLTVTLTQTSHPHRHVWLTLMTSLQWGQYPARLGAD